jgi:hypothetical protein
MIQIMIQLSSISVGSWNEERGITFTLQGTTNTKVSPVGTELYFNTAESIGDKDSRLDREPSESPWQST